MRNRIETIYSENDAFTNSKRLDTRANEILVREEALQQGDFRFYSAVSRPGVGALQLSFFLALGDHGFKKRGSVSAIFVSIIQRAIGIFKVLSALTE